MHFNVLGRDFGCSTDAILRMLDEGPCARGSGVDDGVDIGGQDGRLSDILQAPFARSRENLSQRLGADSRQGR